MCSTIPEASWITATPGPGPAAVGMGVASGLAGASCRPARTLGGRVVLVGERPARLLGEARLGEQVERGGHAIRGLALLAAVGSRAEVGVEGGGVLLGLGRDLAVAHLAAVFGRCRLELQSSGQGFS